MADKKKPIDPLSITESLGFQTFRRESRKPWTKDEDILLITLYNQNYSNISSDLVKWETISRHFNNRKPKDCRKRWQNSLDPSLKKGKWTAEEDENLIQAYHKYGASWQKVSNEIVGRTDDQCAKRYIEVLDPNTKDRLRPWKNEEDLELIRKVKKYGTKWRTISLEMSGRPSLTCRNRWRKIVTSVVRGKADELIRKEVELVNDLKKLSSALGDHDDDVPPIEPGSPESNLHANSSKGKSHSISSDKVAPSSSASSISQPGPSTIPQSKEQVQQINSSQPKSQHKPPTSTPTPNSNINANTPSGAMNQPVQTEVEWKYTVQPPNQHPVAYGTIANQETVQALITHSKSHNLQITVHQHIHHHYAPHPQPILEPETQLNRYQHFNYLPPLTEVPKLNSSASSPANSSEGKESDLMRLLNGSGKRKFVSMSNGTNHNTTGVHSPSTNSNSTLANSSNTTGNFSNGNGQHKKPKLPTGANKFTTEELDEELDFWETMRSLTQPHTHVTHHHETSSNVRGEGDKGLNRSKAVSAHHPLHYNNLQYKGVSDEEDEEDCENKYGLYYGVFQNQQSQNSNINQNRNQNQSQAQSQNQSQSQSQSQNQDQSQNHHHRPHSQQQQRLNGNNGHNMHRDEHGRRISNSNHQIPNIQPTPPLNGNHHPHQLNSISMNGEASRIRGNSIGNGIVDDHSDEDHVSHTWPVPFNPS